MEFKNTIILGELDYVLSCRFYNVNDKTKCLIYNKDILPMEQNENGSTNINTLYVLNETLEKILEYKENNGGQIQETCYISIPKKLYTLIHKGAYKNWIKNNGVAKTGTIFDKREIREWERFAELYSKLFIDITLRDLTYYEISKPRYDIANMQKHAQLIKLMKNKIEENKKQQMKDIIGLEL